MVHEVQKWCHGARAYSPLYVRALHSDLDTCVRHAGLTVPHRTVAGYARGTAALLTAACRAPQIPSTRALYYTVDRARASALIVTALDETALRVVQKVNGNPSQMMTKLDERYNSTSTAAKYDRVTLMESYWEAGDACTD